MGPELLTHLLLCPSILLLYPFKKMLSPLSKVQEHEGEREHVCFLLPDNSKALPGTRSYCIACTPLNPNNCFALLLMLTLYNHSQTVRSSPFSSRRRALERLSRNGLLTCCTHHPVLKSVLDLTFACLQASTRTATRRLTETAHSQR